MDAKPANLARATGSRDLRHKKRTRTARRSEQFETTRQSNYIRASTSGPYLTKVGPVSVPEDLRSAVAELNQARSVEFEITPEPVTGTRLYGSVRRQPSASGALYRQLGDARFSCPRKLSGRSTGGFVFHSGASHRTCSSRYRQTNQGSQSTQCDGRVSHGHLTR